MPEKVKKPTKAQRERAEQIALFEEAATRAINCTCIGIDASLTGCGVVVLDGSGVVIEEHVFGYGLKKDARLKEKVERRIEIATETAAVVKRHQKMGNVVVGIEDYAYSRFGKQLDLAELRGVLLDRLHLTNALEPEILSSTEARKVVLGDGGLPKPEIVKRLKRRGLLFVDHNAADAYVVAECLRRGRAAASVCQQPRPPL